MCPYHQPTLFYVPMPRIVWLMAEYCTGTPQEKENSLKELHGIFDAHTMARERFLNVCRRDVSGVPEVQELIRFAEDTMPSPRT